jgi:hypothetical protein
MRRTAVLLISMSIVTSPALASADSFNSMNHEPSTGVDTMSWMYGPNQKERSATAVLAKLRALCASDHHYDQYFCARGMKVLNKAYTEYKLLQAARQDNSALISQ